VIRGTDPSSVSVGQIIVFRNNPLTPDFLVIHRVVGIVQPNASSNVYPGQYGFRTKGDNNPGPDCWTPSCYIPGSWVVGVYQFTIPIPYLGSAILGIRDFMYDPNTGQVNPQGILVILALIIALFAFEVATPPKKKPSDKEAVADSARADAPPAPESPPHNRSDG